MGQCISVPQRKLSLMRDSSSRCFYKSKPGNLSATFHVLDSNLHWDRLNVNMATEEQLMTLPAINRTIAENIIEYRQKIGGFKKVEDLALVSGVGATKLEQFRTEVCVGRRKYNGSSYNSSLTQSMESLQTNEVSNRSSPMKLINLNTANVFQLMSICRMTQEMAAHIVHYRDRKGPFKSVNDLLKVKGLPPDRLAIVKMYLTVDPSTDSSKDSFVNNGINQNVLCVKQPSYHRRTSSAPCGFGKSKSCDLSTKDLYEIISSQVKRPMLKEEFRFCRAGKEALRIGSWNLQSFSLDKARNPGVREVICRTILENGLSIVAVQDVASKEALSLISSELNEPKLQNIKCWEGLRGKWHSILPPQLSTAQYEITQKKIGLNGFLYDTSKGLQLQDSAVLHLPRERQKTFSFTCQPFLGFFKIGNVEFVAVSFNLVSEIYVSKLLPLIVQLLKERIPDEKNVFIMGNFLFPPGHTVFEVLSSQGFTHMIMDGTPGSFQKQQEDSHLWASANIQKFYTGHNGIIAEGMSHILIPKGWEWGGRVSDSSPVWAELYTEEDSTPVGNGVCKMAADTGSLLNSSSRSKDESRDHKGSWASNWVWKYNQKSGISCEKNGIAKGNGTV